jgi:hypothetical protein
MSAERSNGEAKDSPRRLNFYRSVLNDLKKHGFRYGVMGGHATSFYSQGDRKPTADLDIGIPEEQVDNALHALAVPGRSIVRKHDWLKQVWTDSGKPNAELSIDVILGHSTGLAKVQDWWIERGVDGEYLGEKYHFVAPEAIALTKMLLMFRRRHDIPDAVQVTYGSQKERPFGWQLLMDNLGPEKSDWRLAYALAVFTEILYGTESEKALPQNAKDRLHNWFAPNQIAGPVRGNYFAYDVDMQEGSQHEEAWRNKSMALAPKNAVDSVLEDLHNWHVWQDGDHSHLIDAARKIVGQGRNFDWDKLIQRLGDNWRMALVAMLSTEILFGATGSEAIAPQTRTELSKRFRDTRPTEGGQGPALFPDRSWNKI